MCAYRHRSEESDEEEDEENSEEERPMIPICSYSDGLKPEDVGKVNPNIKLVRADCCQKYFAPEGYKHQTEFGLQIQGITTCIHCYIDFNSNKFVDCVGMTQKDKECLRYYIDNFTKDHQTSTCLRGKHGGKCILCNALKGRYPSAIATYMEQEMVKNLNHQLGLVDLADSDIGTDSDLGYTNLFNDVRVVSRSTITNNQPSNVLIL
jgi:hypothetical protein